MLTEIKKIIETKLAAVDNMKIVHGTLPYGCRYLVELDGVRQTLRAFGYVLDISLNTNPSPDALASTYTIVPIEEPFDFEKAARVLIQVYMGNNPFSEQEEPLDGDDCSEIIKKFRDIVLESQGEFEWQNELINVRWCLADIKGEIERYANIEPSEENCREVASAIEKNHDAGIGINWEVISTNIEYCFPDAELKDED